MRNDRMRERGWLDAGQFPSNRFRVANVRETGGDCCEVAGDFAMKGVARRIAMMATVRHRPESDATRLDRLIAVPDRNHGHRHRT